MGFKDNFKDVIAPLKYLDSKIHRSYFKISKRFSNKKIFWISSMLGFSGVYGTSYFMDFYIGSPNPLKDLIGKSLWTPTNLAIIFDGCYNLSGLFGVTKLNEHTDGSISPNIMDALIIKISKNARLPMISTGFFLLGKTFLNAFNYFYSGEPISNETLAEGLGSYGFLSIASSIYLKDRDPKLLEKQPMWKDALDLVKKGYEKLVPLPAPQPSPVRVNYSLEDKI